MMLTLAIALAGAAGATARYLVDSTVRRWTSMPWATFGINVTGSFLLGVIAGLVLYSGQPHQLELIVGTGFCGGYTTFSTASWDAVELWRNTGRRHALVYAAASLVCSVAACGVGMVLVS